MKKIVAISGSGNPNSSNIKLINSIINLFESGTINFFDISPLPLFKDGHNGAYPENILKWKRILKNSDGLIIATPEYLQNIPAALKNALEWVTQTGEMFDKKVLPITFTPSPPRGEKAMQSLIWTLQALDAQIVTKLDLYQLDTRISNNKLELNSDVEEVLVEAVKLLLD